MLAPLNYKVGASIYAYAFGLSEKKYVGFIFRHLIPILPNMQFVCYCWIVLEEGDALPSGLKHQPMIIEDGKYWWDKAEETDDAKGFGCRSTWKARISGFHEFRMYLPDLDDNAKLHDEYGYNQMSRNKYKRQTVTSRYYFKPFKIHSLQEISLLLAAVIAAVASVLSLCLIA